MSPSGDSGSVGDLELSSASLLAPATFEPGPGLFVSTTGNDANPGTQQQPFKTLTRARDVLRTQRARESKRVTTTIYLRSGTYRQTTPLTLNAQDAALVIRSFPGERATLSGGPLISPQALSPVTDSAVRNRLPAAVRDHVRQLDLGALGLGAIPAMPRIGHSVELATLPPELFINGAALTVARWPNVGFLRTANAQGAENAPVSFTSASAVGKQWKKPAEAMIFGYLNYAWADISLHISSFNSATGAVSTSDAAPYGIANGRPYYFFNILEELDAPGEYVIDRESKKLYVYPPGGWEKQSILLSTMDQPVLSVNSSSNITVKYLTIASTRSNGIFVNGSSSVTFSDLLIQDVGKTGLLVWNGTGVKLRNSTIRETGVGGVDLTGGNRTQLTAGGHVVENSTFRSYSRIRRTYSPAITLNGVGNQALHNDIADAPHSGIIFQGNNHTIEYNNIHHILTKSGDAGAIYTGRDWSSAGTKVRYNYVHDLGSAEYDNQVGIYLDDFASGITVQGNVIARTDIGVLIGGGRNNIASDNAVVSTKIPVLFDARGVDWASAACTPPDGVMFTNLQAVPYTSSVWVTHYPWLPKIPSDQPCLPKHNTLTRNVYWQSGASSIAKEIPALNTLGTSWAATSDPGFINAAASNYRFASDAPVFQHIPRFLAPPFTDMGRR